MDRERERRRLCNQLTELFGNLANGVVSDDFSGLEFAPSHHMVYRCIVHGYHDVWYTAIVDFIHKLHRRPDVLRREDVNHVLWRMKVLLGDVCMFATKTVVPRYKYLSIEKLFEDQQDDMERARAKLIKQVTSRSWTKLRVVSMWLAIYGRARFAPGGSGFLECKASFECAASAQKRGREICNECSSDEGLNDDASNAAVRFKRFKTTR